MRKTVCGVLFVSGLYTIGFMAGVMTATTPGGDLAWVLPFGFVAGAGGTFLLNRIAGLPA